MKHLIAALAVLIAVIAFHTEAHAACTTQTYMLPGQPILMCTTCCTAGFCNTHCI